MKNYIRSFQWMSAVWLFLLLAGCDTVETPEKISCTPGVHVMDNGACGPCNSIGDGLNDSAVVLDDGNPCTWDACDPAAGATHEALNGPCDDGDPATINDTCVAGVCQGEAEICTAGEWSLNGGRCKKCNDAGTGYTGDGVPLEALGCVDVVCNTANGVLYQPVSWSCDDGNPLTPDDTCIDGTCIGMLDADGDGVPNHGAGEPCTGGSTEDCLDNCPLRPNADQLDTDGDGLGDACATVRIWSKVEVSDPEAPGSKVVALTFDDGWSDAHLAGILDVLWDRKVKATFFLNGMYINNGALKMATLLRLKYEGHNLGNHTTDHTIGGNAADTADAVLSNEEIHQQLGLGTLRPLYRAPAGVVADYMDQALEDTGFVENIHWSIDPEDWTDPEPPGDLMVTCSTEKAQPGDILLFHAGPAVTPQMLGQLIDSLRAAGFGFVTVEQLVAFGEPVFVDESKMCLDYYKIGGEY